MKIINCSDLHIFGKNPSTRVDNLSELQFIKLQEIVSISNQFNAPIVCNGDIFDSPNVSYSIWNKTAEILSNVINGFYFLMGQHDLFYHNLANYKATAVGALLQLDNIFLMERFNEHYPKYAFDIIHWEQEPKNKTKHKFLISHKPVITRFHEHTIPWIKYNPEKVFKINDLPKYDLILYGDWHRTLHIKYKGTLLLNPGAMTRRKYNVDAEKSHPSIFLINLDTLEYKLIPLKSAPKFEEIFAEKCKFKTDEIVNQQLQNFINSIKERKTDSSKFLSSLFTFTKKDDISEPVREYIRDIIVRTFNKIPYID